jgi:hypothetical protein
MHTLDVKYRCIIQYERMKSLDLWAQKNRVQPAVPNAVARVAAAIVNTSPASLYIAVMSAIDFHRRKTEDIVGEGDRSVGPYGDFFADNAAAQHASRKHVLGEDGMDDKVERSPTDVSRESAHFFPQLQSSLRRDALPARGVGGG